MKGPSPKPAALRQRRNRSSTAAVLSAETEARPRTPRLPRGTQWHKLTRAWWRDVWRSPMAPEFLRADVHGLYLLAELVDRFWTKPTSALAAEIRLQRQCFGLTPIDRRRLQWEVERAEAATRKRGPSPPPPLAEDPRRVLTVVS